MKLNSVVCRRRIGAVVQAFQIESWNLQEVCREREGGPKASRLRHDFRELRRRKSMRKQKRVGRKLKSEMVKLGLVEPKDGFPPSLPGLPAPNVDSDGSYTES